ncbi:hypothetical protein GCM10027343_09370 [Noviherbaspirillum agri]
MASNLKSARQAIEAELAHARQGATYYSTRVEALEAALEQLESVEADGDTSTRATKRGATGAKQAEPRRGRKRRSASGGAQRGNGAGAPRQQQSQKQRAARASRAAGSLPTTGGDFWLKLVSDEPRSAVDISNAAIEALGIRPDQKEEIQKLKQRVSPALAGLLSAHKIQDTGAGRERRFFKSESAAA